MEERKFIQIKKQEFGIKEYIDMPGVKYNPDIGMFGFDVCVTLNKWGFRIKDRKRKRQKVPSSHRITKEEAIDFTTKKLNIEVI